MTLNHKQDNVLNDKDSNGDVSNDDGSRERGGKSYR